MRNLIIGMFFIGLTNLAIGQQREDVAKEVELAEVTLTAINSDYLLAVQDHQTPAAARALESMAANYDVKASPHFNAVSKIYEITFRNRLGSIYAVYDPDGEMLAAFENIKNVSPPQALRETIFEEYPGWTIAKSKYQVRYLNGKDAKRQYKAQLRNGNKKKTMKYKIQGTSDIAGELDAILADNRK
jgi:hypothetical protein